MNGGAASPDAAACRWAQVVDELRRRPRRWLVTGAAGFIGSHLVEALLGMGQEVVALDNFSTGTRENLACAGGAAAEGGARLRLIEGDVRDPDACARACLGVDAVLHQAALGSVPRSFHDPQATHASNVDGFFTLLTAVRAAGTPSFVYASSSAVYGDHPDPGRVEGRLGRLASPYAVSKYANELYAGVFRDAFGVPAIGLRYFNVFGPRQDAHGSYAAVIPLWVAALLHGEPCIIHGDGETTRDFCPVENVVRANLLAALAPPEAVGGVYNVGCGAATSLNELFALIRGAVAIHRPEAAAALACHGPARNGDPRSSVADLALTSSMLGYRPVRSVAEGLEAAVGWYAEQPAHVRAAPLLAHPASA
jgi:UDP-N-acetylglucosamine/UDP-N-acetylgalactosamine 4-epimerase